MKPNNSILIAIIVMCIVTIPATAYPTGDNIVTIEDVTLAPGTTTDVPIRLLNSSGVGGVTVTLTFDPSIVNITNIIVGDFDGIFIPDYSDVDTGTLLINCMASGEDMTGDLTIATITLEAVGTSGSCELGLSADLSTKSGNTVPSSTNDGTVTVNADNLIDRYDIDNDGIISKDEAITAISDYFDDKISKDDVLEVLIVYFEDDVDTYEGDVDTHKGLDARDVSYLAKHVAEIPGYDTLYGDGDVDTHEGLDARDVSYLAKHVAEIPGYETFK